MGALHVPRGGQSLIRPRACGMQPLYSENISSCGFTSSLPPVQPWGLKEYGRGSAASDMVM